MKGWRVCISQRPAQGCRESSQKYLAYLGTVGICLTRLESSLLNQKKPKKQPNQKQRTLGPDAEFCMLEQQGGLHGLPGTGSAPDVHAKTPLLLSWSHEDMAL